MEHEFIMNSKHSKINGQLMEIRVKEEKKKEFSNSLILDKKEKISVFVSSDIWAMELCAATGAAATTETGRKC